jgi:uncharacterized RDD family membrane protein YckC
VTNEGGQHGQPGPRWGGDGSLRPHPPAPADDPASPAHGARFERPPQRPPLELPPWPLAPLWRRGAAWLIDLAIKLVLIEFVFLFAGVDVSARFALSALLPAQALAHGYNWLFWTQGWTPASRLLGMRIVRVDGAAPGMRRGLVRVAGSVLSEVPLFLGYIWAIWDPRRQTWHDRFAGTFVVTSSVDPPRR